jgi:hypothetical protein
MGMRILGLQKAMNSCDRFEKELMEAAQDGVDKSTDDLYDESQVQVPKKTGKLAESGRRVAHSSSGPRRSKGIKYGYQVADSSDEEVLDYAAAVHEILKASHASPTKAKFVEDPLVQGIKGYHHHVREAVNRHKRKAFR